MSSPADEPTAEGVRVTPAPLRVLIVEDNEADAALLRDHLERLADKPLIRWANSRHAFLNEVARGADLILCDYSMPAFGAREVLRILAAEQSDIPVIIISGTIGEEAAVELMKLGAVDYLLKDRLARLDTAIARVVERRRMKAAQQEDAQALRMRDALVRMACRMARMGAWALEVPSMKVTWSDEVRDLHEVAADYEPDVGSAIAFYAPEDRATISEAVERCVRAGTPFDLELQLVTHRGRRIWVRALGEAVSDSAGAIRRVQGAIQDISDRKLAEQNLNGLAERLTTTLESITDAFFTVDRAWRFTYINREAERLLGRSRSSMVGKELWAEFPEARGSTFEREYVRAMQDHVSVTFEEHYAPLGLWFEVRAFPSAHGLAVYFRDITERKRHDEERERLLARERAAHADAAAAKAHFKTLFEYIPGLYLALDPQEFRIVAVSDAYLRATMRTREELMGRIIFDVFPDDPAETAATGVKNLRASLKRVKETGRPDAMALQRYPVRRPGGEDGEFVERFWSPLNSPVLGSHRELAYIIHRVEDVTDFVRVKQREGEWEKNPEGVLGPLERMESDLVIRAQDVMKLNEQLHHSEERFRAMFTHAAAGIAIVGPEQMILQANPAFCAIVGYNEEELKDMTFSSLAAPEGWSEQTHERVERLLSGGMASCAIAARFIQKGGAEIWINASISGVSGGRGRPLYLIAVVEDVTDQKEAQLALKASEEYYRILFERNPHPMWVFDVDTKRFLAVNLAAVEKYGYTAEEFRTMTIEDIRPPSELARLHTELALLPTKLKSVGVWKHRKKSGEIIDVEIEADAIRFAGRPARLVLATDITERLRAQARIAQQAALIDQATDAILVRDLNHVIQFWSQGAQRVYGWTAAEAVGRRANELLGRHYEQFTAAMEAVRQTGAWVGELDHVTKDGRALIVAARWSLLRDDHGNPIAVLAINSDVTERKKIEAQFLRTQRLESIGTLAGGIAHDLNNLLAPIVIGVGLLRTSALGGAEQSVLDTIERSAERGTNLVRQVLSFARGVEGSRVTLNVRHLITEVELILADTFPKNVALTTDVARDLPLITGDPTQLNQVLVNICVNARDAMPSGGRLNLSARKAEFDEQYAATHHGASAGTYVLIEVADTGTGIPKEIIGKIFEPFFTTKEPGKGTGLGLATSLGIVRSHGGCLEVHSEPGNGTVFKIYLPAQGAAGDEPESDRPPVELPRGNGECVLFVDDEASIRSISRQTLEAFGYRVITAEDGADAIGKFASNKDEIAVVITDLMMPVLDGHALMAAVRRIAPDVPIIASSGLHAKGEMSRAANVGGTHFIAKPFSAETLLKQLKKVLTPEPSQR